MAKMYEESILRVGGVEMVWCPDDKLLPHLAVDMQNPETMEYDTTQKLIQKHGLLYDRYDYHVYWFFRESWYDY